LKYAALAYRSDDWRDVAFDLLVYGPEEPILGRFDAVTHSPPETRDLIAFEYGKPIRWTFLLVVILGA
jgi:hypothetical protein